jgi:hypothetical protein
LTAELLELALGSLQHMYQHLLFARIVGICEHVLVMRYGSIKAFGIRWQISDGLSFLSKLHRVFCELPPRHKVQGRPQHQMEPTHLGSQLFGGSHWAILRGAQLLNDLNQL